MSDKIAHKPLSGPIEYDFGEQTPEAWPRIYISKDDHVAEKLRYARALTQICSYCGWEAKAGGGSWSELQAHIHACSEHPVGKLTAALRDVMPLLAECDCIHSDRESPLCPCRAARALLASAPHRGAEDESSV